MRAIPINESPVTDRFKAHAALFTATLIFGGNYTIAKIPMDGGYIDPLPFILLRVCGAGLLFWLFHALFVQERVERRDFGRLALCALFGVAINQMMFFSGLELTSPINASLIMTTTPMMVLLASYALLGERITLQKIAGIGTGATGAILLITYGKEVTFSSEQSLGDLMIAINATSYGLYLVLVKSLMRKYNPLTVIKWVFSFGLLFVLPFGLGGLQTTPWHTFSTDIWLSVAYVVLGTSFLAYLLNVYALKMVNASIVSIYIYLQPLLATLIAIAFTSEKLLGIQLVSGTLIFMGVYLVSKPDKKKKDIGES
ncbi:MAG: EamA family transporter [Saprospiraceae bacterium]|nr:EamA family transporter [Saprospiraceae bacterium]